MGQGIQSGGETVRRVVKTAATVLLLGLMVAAGERSLAPLMIDRPDDRTPADVRATSAVYRFIASYATEPDPLQEPLKDF